MFLFSKTANIPIFGRIFILLMLSANAKRFAVFTCFVAWFGMALQYYVVVKNAPSNGLTVPETTGRFFGYFTVLTNLLVGVSLTAILFSRGSLHSFFSKFSTQTAIAVYIFLVGLGYNILLRHLYKMEGLNSLANEIQHVIVPALYTLYWFFFLPKSVLPWKDVLLWLIYPFTYVLFALTRGAMDGFYAYPFIDVSKLGFTSVIRNTIGLLIILIIISALFIAVARQTGRKSS